MLVKRSNLKAGSANSSAGAAPSIFLRATELFGTVIPKAVMLSVLFMACAYQAKSAAILPKEVETLSALRKSRGIFSARQNSTAVAVLSFDLVKAITQRPLTSMDHARSPSDAS